MHRFFYPFADDRGPLRSTALSAYMLRATRPRTGMQTPCINLPSLDDDDQTHNISLISHGCNVGKVTAGPSVKYQDNCISRTAVDTAALAALGSRLYISGVPPTMRDNPRHVPDPMHNTSLARELATPRTLHKYRADLSKYPPNGIPAPQTTCMALSRSPNSSALYILKKEN